MYKPLIHTVGIEVEFYNLPKVWARSIPEASCRKQPWKLVEDGSVRHYLKEHEPLVRPNDQQSVMYGGELISPLIDVTQKGWDKNLRGIIHTLDEWGEGINAKTSLHVHINASGLPMFALHYLFRIAAYLEAAMFRLSIAEAGIHRGELLHDYGYCRPITRCGPPVTMCTDNKYRPVFELETLLATETITEFQQACGRYDRSGGKYHEARYVWINPLSIFQHGSIEFRPFNMTLNPSYIVAWVHLCMAIVRESFGKQTELPINPLGSESPDFEDIIEFLAPEDDTILYSLEDLWNIGRWCAPIHGYQLGHLERYVDWERTKKKLIPDPVDGSDLNTFKQWDTDEIQMVPGFIHMKTAGTETDIDEDWDDEEPEVIAAEIPQDLIDALNNMEPEPSSPEPPRRNYWGFPPSSVDSTDTDEPNEEVF